MQSVYIEEKHQWILADLSAMTALGKTLAEALSRARTTLPDALSSGMIIYLEGDLGAGKTTLVRSMLWASGHSGAVKSPTYGLVEVYQLGHLYWHHFDCYRLNTPEEFLDAGLETYFSPDTICLVEWPEKAGKYLPQADWRLRFDFATPGSEARQIELVACSERGKACLRYLNPI